MQRKSELREHRWIDGVVWIVAAIVAVVLFTLVVVWPSGVSAHLRGLLFVVAGALALLLAARKQARRRHSKG